MPTITFPNHEIIPDSLVENYRKVRALNQGNYLFQGEEIVNSRNRFRMIAIITTIVLAIALLISGLLVDSMIKEVILPQLAREAHWITILKDVWMLPVFIGILLVTALQIVLAAWRRHKNISMLEETKLLFIEKICTLGDDVRLLLQRKVKGDKSLKDVFDIYARLRCLEVTRTTKGTDIIYVHEPLWESATQYHKVMPPARAVAAKFSFRLPLADALEPAMYQSPDLFKEKDIYDDTTQIVWLVEIWQKSKKTESHFLIPITVRA